MQKLDVVAMKSTLDTWVREVEKQLEEAYDRGFEEGIAVKLPTQKEFDSAHAQPQPYGEESEWLVVSANTHTEEQALRKIRRYMKQEWSLTGDELPAEVRWYGVGYRRYDGELGYWLSRDGAGIWGVYGVETQ